MCSAMTGYALEIAHIARMLPGLGIAENAEIKVRPGEICAVVGERRALDALTEALMGLSLPVRGEIRVNGEEAFLSSPREAQARGMAAVYRDGGLDREMTLLDQLRLLPGMPKGKKALRERAEEALAQFSMQARLTEKTGNLPAGEQFRGEMLLALLREPDILIVEAPEGRLTPLEWEETAKLLRRAAQEGRSILILTEKEEIASCADAQVILSGERDQALPPLSPKEIAVGSVALEARDLTVAGKSRGRYALRGVSLEARMGEITAVLGLPGSGKRALAGALAGMTPLLRGRVRLQSREITAASVRERMRLGLGFLPGAALHYGMAPGARVWENMALRPYLNPAFQQEKFIRPGEMYRAAEDKLGGLGLSALAGADIGELTPEEMQLCALSREMESLPEVLIALEPTLGLDRAAAREVWNRLLAVQSSRRAVVLLTSDAQEALALSGRVLVLREGEIAGEFEPRFTSARELGLYMTGERQQGGEDRFDEE